MDGRSTIRKPASVLRSIAVVLACAAVASITGAPALGDGTADNVAPVRTPCPKPYDPIAIQSIQLSENPIVAGTSVSGIVTATCNVAAVTAQVGTYRIGVPKTSPGVFRTTVNVPHFIWPGHFTLVVTAIRTDGAKVARTVPIVVRW